MAFTECQLIHYLISVCLSSSLSAQCWQALSLSLFLSISQSFIFQPLLSLFTRKTFFSVKRSDRATCRCTVSAVFYFSCRAHHLFASAKHKTRQDKTTLNIRHACQQCFGQPANDTHTHTHTHTLVKQQNQTKLNWIHLKQQYCFILSVFFLFSLALSRSLSLFLSATVVSMSFDN